MNEDEQMNCLVLAATSFEIAPFLEQWREKKILQQKQVDVLITGVGILAAAYALTSQLKLNRPSFVIQAGIAGSFNKEIPLGEVVAVNKECIADQAVMEKDGYKNTFDLGLVQDNAFPYKKRWLVNDLKMDGLTKLAVVKGITVNEITTSKDRIDLYRKIYGAGIESMEGAALHYICLHEKIPFIQLRGISNCVGERDKSKWKIKDAILALNRELIKLVEKL